MALRRALRLALTTALLASASVALPSRAGAREVPAADFGQDGVAYAYRPDNPWVIDYAEYAAIDPSGGQVLLSGSNLFYNSRPALYRMTPSGATDLAFGDEGLHRLLEGFVVYGLSVGPGGIAVFGQQLRLVGSGAAVSLQRSGMIVRLGLDGRADERFGPGGRVDLGIEGSFVRQLSIGLDGSVVYERITGSTSRLLRISADGQPDAAFGEVDLGSDGYGTSLATTATGAVVVADHQLCKDSSAHCARVRRLGPTGDVDPTFGTGGVTVVRFAYAGLLVSPTDGSILLASNDYYGMAEPFLWRLTPSGKVDRAFGDHGRARIPWITAMTGRTPIAWLDSGHLAVVGSTHEGWTDRILVLRPDGSRDPAFGRGGFVEEDELSYQGIAAHGTRIFTSHTGGSPVTIVTARDLDIDDGAPRVSSVVPTGTSVQVRWEPPRVPLPSPVQSYRVVVSSEGTVMAQASASRSSRQATVSGVGPDWRYDVVVEAHLLSGEVRTSPLVADVSGPALVTPPSHATLRRADMGNGYVVVSWRPPIDDGGSPVVAYSLIALERESRKLVAWRNFPADVRTGAITGLTNDLPYDLYIVPWNTAGAGPAGDPGRLTPTTQGPDAEPPTLVWWTASRNGSTVTAEWSEPVELGQVATGFDVVLVADGKVVQWVQPSLTERRVVLRNVPSGPVDAYVFVHTAAGFGPVGDPVALT